MTIGKCDNHWVPGVAECEVFTSTIDVGGSLHTQQLCAACGGVESVLDKNPEIAPMLAILQSVSKMPTPDGLELPHSFFGKDGYLRRPPWQYGSTMVDLVRSARKKELRIMVPVSALTALSDSEIIALLKMTRTLAKAFESMLPKDWKVVA